MIEDPLERGTGPMKTRLRRKAMGWAAVAVLALVPGAGAQVVSPLYVGNSVPVTNALGRPFRGVNGYPEISARVEIRETGPGIVAPDPATGEGNDAVNPLVRVSYIGHDAPFENSGLFSETFSNRLEVGKSYFARVYDGAAPGGSMYYLNSATFAGPPGGVSTLDVVFQGRYLVNGEPDLDSDGDGIPDAMEMDMGLDSNNPDTDGDGFADRFEELNEYVDPKEARPLDLWIQAPSAGADWHSVGWWTIPGVAYRLEFRPQWVDGEPYITDVWTGVASGTEIGTLEVDVEDWVTNSPFMGFFRVFAIP